VKYLKYIQKDEDIVKALNRLQDTLRGKNLSKKQYKYIKDQFDHIDKYTLLPAVTFKS
jgi:ribosome assembly protein YihI (activator of Der GTPase)